MAGRARDPGFFVGYLNKVPRSFAIFLAVAAAALVGSMAGLGFALGTNVNDPGDGAFAARKLGKQEMTGVLLENPYPILRVRPDAKNPEPRTVMLTVPGKRSVKRRGRKLFDQLVDVKGFMFLRGDIDMLQVQGKNSLAAVEAGEGEPPPQYTPAPPESLGRWRLIGEICDGKCYLGAMRPGTGLAHKACANLCISSGAPPVFVTATEGAVEGKTYMLMADKDGGPLPDNFGDYVAVLVQLEGEIERLDDLLVFKVDFDKAEVL